GLALPACVPHRSAPAGRRRQTLEYGAVSRAKPNFPGGWRFRRSAAAGVGLVDGVDDLVAQDLVIGLAAEHAKDAVAEGLDLVSGAAALGQEDDREALVWACLAQGVVQLEAVAAGEEGVKQDHIRPPAVVLNQGGLGVGDRAEIGHASDDAGGASHELRVIVDQQNASYGALYHGSLLHPASAP